MDNNEEEDSPLFGQSNFPSMSSIFSGGYQMTPDASGWEPRFPANIPPQQEPMLGAFDAPDAMAQGDTEAPDFAEESKPLIAAIESGYADKKLMSPVEMIREGARTGDQETVEKGHKKLIDMLSGQRSFGERFSDNYFRNHEFGNTVQKMAADIVMKEMLRPGSTAAPMASDAVQMGLIHPNELNPESQVTKIPGKPWQTPPGYGVLDLSVLPPSIPPTPPETRVNTGARLTPFQEDVVRSRQHGLQTGLAYKAALAAQRGALTSSQEELNREKARSIKDKREVDDPAKRKALTFLNSLREAQTRLTEAKVDWVQQLPDLRRELHTNTTPFELDALKRVHTAIRERKPIEKADWLIAQRWLSKSPRFSVDSLGRIYDRLTGEGGKEGLKHSGLNALLEAPDLDPEQHAEAQDMNDDIIHQLGQFIGSLIRPLPQGEKPQVEKPSSSAPTTPTKPASPPAGGLSVGEIAELEALRKKHGRRPSTTK